MCVITIKNEKKADNNNKYNWKQWVVIETICSINSDAFHIEFDNRSGNIEISFDYIQNGVIINQDTKFTLLKHSTKNLILQSFLDAFDEYKALKRGLNTI